MAGRIFVSYQRAETAPQVGWLYDRLASPELDVSRLVQALDQSIAAVEFDNFTAAQIRA